MLNWDEIRNNAQRFVAEWDGETREKGEYQLFWEDFFGVFGIKRRSVAVYQKKVETLGSHRGFVDLFWPGMLLVEHKSAGKDLDDAFTQAINYFEGLTEDEKPRYVIVTDYRTFRFYDLEGERAMGEFGMIKKEFTLRDLPENIRLFKFIIGYENEVHASKTEHPNKISWDEVRFIRGVHQDRMYRLEFSIAGQEVMIRCSEDEILNVNTVLTKMQLVARKLIDCPYIGKHEKKNWLPGAVFLWLDKIAKQGDKYGENTESVKRVIKDYSSKSISGKASDRPYNQSKDSVQEDQTVFMPFRGLINFVRKNIGADIGERYLIKILVSMGARRVKKGKNSNIFYALNYDEFQNSSFVEKLEIKENIQ